MLTVLGGVATLTLFVYLRTVLLPGRSGHRIAEEFRPRQADVEAIALVIAAAVVITVAGAVLVLWRVRLHRRRR